MFPYQKEVERYLVLHYLCIMHYINCTTDMYKQATENGRIFKRIITFLYTINMKVKYIYTHQ